MEAINKPKINMKVYLVFAKRHMEDFESRRQTIMWSECKALCLEKTRHSSPNTIPIVKHGGGSIMLWGCFSVAGTVKLVKIEGKMNGAKYRQILYGSLLQSANDLRLGRSLRFQKDNDPKHTAKALLEWLKNKNVKVLSGPTNAQT
jgi:hypothetical protein